MEIAPIPKETAWQLCAEIRQENQGRWYSYRAWWCWGCAKASQGNPDKMCVSNAPGYRGCLQVNTRYDRMPR